MRISLVDSLAAGALALALSFGEATPAQAQNSMARAAYKVPRTPDGLPDLQGIWQVRNTTAAFDVQDHAGALGIPPGRSIIVQPADGKIPYKAEALAKRQENFKNRDAADTLNKCYMPGVPRINYLNFPFQIFETPKYTLIAYEYIHNYRTIFTNGTQHLDGLDWWNGDSRGHWEGDSLVVDVTDFNDQTWFDASGDYHSGKLHVVERYTRTGPDTLQYEATMEDPEVFMQPWTISVPLYRHTEPNFRVLEYECQAYADEAGEGKWPVMKKTSSMAATVFFLAAILSMAQPPAPPQGGSPGSPPAGGGNGGAPAFFGGPPHKPGGPVQHLADGHPDMQGFWNSANNGGAVFELQNHPNGRRPFFGPGKGAIVDPADGFIPYTSAAAAKAKDLFENHLADEPELHCYESGVPKQMYVQFGFQMLQPANYLVLTWEFMHAYRIIPTDGRPHIPANIKLFQGDSVGHWEGDTLVVDTTNLSDHTWYDTVGNFHSDAEHVVERFTPLDTNTVKYEAIVEDSKVLTQPFKMEMELDRNPDPKYEQMEFGCIEGNQDVKHYTKDKGGAADVKVK